MKQQFPALSLLSHFSVSLCYLLPAFLWPWPMDLLCQPLKNKEERYCKSAHMSESTLASSWFISCFLVFRPVFCKSTAFWEMQRYIKHKTKCHTGLKRGSEARVSGGTCMCLTCEGKRLQRHYWLNSGLTLK